jgi:hypothetical protein
VELTIDDGNSVLGVVRELPAEHITVDLHCVTREAAVRVSQRDSLSF